jgi:Domain of unknown function (DUF4281)
MKHGLEHNLYNVKIYLDIVNISGHQSLHCQNREAFMTADQVFSIANAAALVGWIVLAAAVIFKRPFWRDQIAGRAFPMALAILYTALIVFFFGQAEGGFGSLADVQKLFTAPWVVVAGWVHYLAFDLFVGAWIARQIMELGLPRWLLIILLPLTFMFGPVGYLGFEAARVTFIRGEGSAS